MGAFKISLPILGNDNTFKKIAEYSTNVFVFFSKLGC